MGPVDHRRKGNRKVTLPIRLAIVILLALVATFAGIADADATLGPDYHMLRPNAIEVSEFIKQHYPQVPEIGGWRDDPFPDHPSGQAVDIMVLDPVLGDRIVDDLHANALSLGLRYTIWKQRLRRVDGSGHLMKDRGDPRQNHFDHIHVMTN